MPGGYAGKLLRVDLTTGKCWTEPWGPEEMREQLGGIGLGASILYKEVPAKAHWDHPGQSADPRHRARWPGCRCGARAGSRWSRAAP